ARSRDRLPRVEGRRTPPPERPRRPAPPKPGLDLASAARRNRRPSSRRTQRRRTAARARESSAARTQAGEREAVAGDGKAGSPLDARFGALQHAFGQRGNRAARLAADVVVVMA